MAFLFNIEGKLAHPNVEVLLISPFKEIWDRDLSNSKSRAREEFAYIEFMTSFLKSNPYKGYSPEVRKKKIIEEVITYENFYEDDLIKAGMKKMEEFQKEASPTYTLYSSALNAKYKLEDFLNTFDINERNPKTGMPIMKVKEITSALLDVDKVTSSLNSLKRKVEEELYESIKTRGQKEISPFANPESLNR